jgi:hypothetical protein
VKRFSFSLNSTIRRPKPAWEKKAAKSNAELLVIVVIIEPPSMYPESGIWIPVIDPEGHHSFFKWKKVFRKV